ncbi:GHMP family kinase ATP-binding protein [Methylobacter luteus]|uniref:GHMP family kinase ATP-binding protein n=1 Tax=Methylobacter luteus TaxID=415 RepID=UPI00041639C4|nr:kinase [Methylobacter luteus]
MSSKIGLGYAIGHHGEILQGMIDLPFVGQKHFLVSLISPDIKSRAKFTLSKTNALKVQPEWKTKSLRAAGLTMTYAGYSNQEGLLEIESNSIPCLGFGTSTSDVVATIRAVAQTLDCRLSAEEISRIAVQAEFACDPCMYDNQVVVFLQRDGLVKEFFANNLPATAVLGFDTCPFGNGVSTLDLPYPDYGKIEIRAFKQLIKQLRIAIDSQSVPLLGKICTESAVINQQFLPKSHFSELLEIQKQVGAYGLQIAHSGSIAGFIFDVKNNQFACQKTKAITLLKEIGINTTWQFSTSRNAL